MAQNLFPGMSANALLAQQFTRPQPASASPVPVALDAASLRAGAKTGAQAFGRPSPSQRPSAVRPPFQQAKRSSGPTGMTRPPKKGADIARSGIPSIPGFNLPQSIPGQIAPRKGAGKFVPNSLRRPMVPSQQWQGQPQMQATNYDPHLALLSVVGSSGGLSGLSGWTNTDEWWTKESNIPGKIKDKWNKHCDDTYGANAGYRDACKAINRSPGGPQCGANWWAPWTICGKQARGLPVDWAAEAKQAAKDAEKGKADYDKLNPKSPAPSASRDWNAILSTRTDSDLQALVVAAQSDRVPTRLLVIATDADKIAESDYVANKSTIMEAAAAAMRILKAHGAVIPLPGSVVNANLVAAGQQPNAPAAPASSNTALYVGGAAVAAAAAWFFFLRNK